MNAPSKSLACCGSVARGELHERTDARRGLGGPRVGRLRHQVFEEPAQRVLREPPGGNRVGHVRVQHAGGHRLAIAQPILKRPGTRRHVRVAWFGAVEKLPHFQGRVDAGLDAREQT